MSRENAGRGVTPTGWRWTCLRRRSRTCGEGRCRSETTMSVSVQFPAIIRIRGINPYVLVSARRAQAIKPGWRKPLPVRVRLNGKPAKGWRINLMPVGNGSFYLYLHGQVRKASGAAVGDRVEVEIEFDAGYRDGPQHPMPRWFQRALAAN